jgi:hypothetical protein
LPIGALNGWRQVILKNRQNLILGGFPNISINSTQLGGPLSPAIPPLDLSVPPGGSMHRDPVAHHDAKSNFL